MTHHLLVKSDSDVVSKHTPSPGVFIMEDDSVCGFAVCVFDLTGINDSLSIFATMFGVPALSSVVI